MNECGMQREMGRAFHTYIHTCMNVVCRERWGELPLHTYIHTYILECGMQREMEREAARRGGGGLTAPVQRVTDFLDAIASKDSSNFPTSSYR